MAKKARAPKKETLTEREKELLKQSKAEKRVNGKYLRVNTIIAGIIVVLLIGISTAVGILVDFDSLESTPIIDADTGTVDILKTVSNYDATVTHLKNNGYNINIDFTAAYGASYNAGQPDENGLVGVISEKIGEPFKVMYFKDKAAADDFYKNGTEMEYAAVSGMLFRQTSNVIFYGSSDKDSMFFKCIWDLL